MAEERRPTGLIGQLKAIWYRVERLERDDPPPSSEGGSAPSDPGDITVYFENGLTGA